MNRCARKRQNLYSSPKLQTDASLRVEGRAECLWNRWPNAPECAVAGTNGIFVALAAWFNYGFQSTLMFPTSSSITTRSPFLVPVLLSTVPRCHPYYFQYLLSGYLWICFRTPEFGFMFCLVRPEAEPYDTRLRSAIEPIAI